MIQMIESMNNAVNNFIWGVPAMICIIGVGLYLSISLQFIQIRKLPLALKETIGKIFHNKEAAKGALTPFQAVCTALAATGGGRCYCHWWPRSGILDVDICTFRNVYEICRGCSCGSFS